MDSHHKVFPYWARASREHSQPLRLITFDYHTDTSAPFRNYLKAQEASLSATERQQLQSDLCCQLVSLDPEISNYAQNHLSNDEHILAGLKAGVLRDALVISPSAQNTEHFTYREHRIICRGFLEDRSSERSFKEEALESSFLTQQFLSLDSLLSDLKEPVSTETPYILDFDLDYFNTFGSITPNDPSFIIKLARGAKLITIATEPTYVSHCSFDKDLSSEYLLEKLIQLFKF